MDVEALRLLNDRKKDLKGLPDPSKPDVTYDTFETAVTKTMSHTHKTIQEVSSYAEKIGDELQSIRQLVKKCSVQIGEQIKELMKNDLLKESNTNTGSGNYTFTGQTTGSGQLSDWDSQQETLPRARKIEIDKKKLEQLQMMQKLAKQQQELMEFISKTEELALKVENDAELSFSDISAAKGHLDQWCDGLETLEEKKRRIREEIEKEEREKKEKEEAERRRKEKEEKEAEEKKRRQEEEKKRRDWKNWPPFTYMNARKNKFNHDVCCVVFTMPSEIQQDDLACHSSDDERDIGLCIESNDEQVISSLITIKPTNDKKITFQMPTRVYVPIVSHDQNLDTKLKFKINGKKKWRTGKSLPDVELPGVLNVAFVGVEIPVKTLKNIECIAVARYKRDETEVDADGKIFEPEGDRNIKVKFPPKSFPGKTTVATKTVPWTHKDIKNASKKYKELQNIKTAGSLIDISCENSTNEDSDLEMYDFGWVVDKNLQKHQSVNQETLNRCSRWLVNNMNPDENSLLLDDGFDSDFIEDLETKESQGDKNRRILRKLHDVTDSDFDKFVGCLDACQPEVANRIRDVREQVKRSRNSNGTNPEDNFASDFDTDFERKEGTVCVVSKLTGKTWEIVTIEASDEHPKARYVKLPAGNDKFQILGLVVPEGIPNEDICRAAEILEGLNCVTNVSVICRQKRANPHDVVIECVRSENVADTIHHLDALGYNYGPSESSEFGVVDGEEIEIKVEHNLRLERYRNSSIKLKFYKNIASDRYSGHLAIVNKGDQGEDEQYHGHLSYSVSSGRLSVSRCGKMVLYVPKPLEEVIGYFPYTLDVPVKALAKFISWQLTKDNSNSTRWVRLAGYLTDGDKHVYHQIIKYIDTETPGAQQRDRCESFIMYWAKHNEQFASDKIGKIIAAHHDERLESEAQQFIKPYVPGKGLLSNDNLEKMAYAVARDWENMAKKLGVSSDEINQIKSSQPGTVRQTLRMLDVWRLSNSAIQKGTDLVKSLHEAAKSAQCGAKLLSMISNHV